MSFNNNDNFGGNQGGSDGSNGLGNLLNKAEGFINQGGSGNNNDNNNNQQSGSGNNITQSIDNAVDNAVDKFADQYIPQGSEGVANKEINNVINGAINNQANKDTSRWLKHLKVRIEPEFIDELATNAAFESERKIDSFEARFNGIEKLLRNLTASLSGGPPNTGVSRSSTSPITEPKPPVYNEPQPPSLVGDKQPQQEPFEGDSSMTAHTVFASNFLEQAVTSSQLGKQLSPDFQNALRSLQRIVRIQNKKSGPFDSKFVHRKPLPKAGLSGLSLPPTEVVLKLLREIKAAPPMTFMMSCAFISIDDFVESCRKVFFATDDYSMETFIIVNAGLHHLFEEKSVTGDSMSEEYVKYHYLCRDNLETALANLPFFLHPRKEIIEALLLGVTYSIGISKFTLAWELNSAAAGMCRTLGWHRLSDTGDEINKKHASIFWFCYTLDKSLSLRFGRSSILQDWDISTPRLFAKPGQEEDPLQSSFDTWIESSRIQGDMYEYLYSPAALNRPAEQRVETARHLVSRLKQLWQQMQGYSAALKGEKRAMVEARVQDVRDKEWHMTNLEMMLKAGEVGHWTALTLVYRAIPSVPQFTSSTCSYNAECIEAARIAFRCHEECMNLTSSSLFAKVGYLHWTILFTPFTPFIVLFCHVIETSNMDDLQRLAQFVASLQPALKMSQPVEKLHRLCQVLHQVAALYVEARAKAQDDQDQGMMSMIGNDFDMYLSQLGLVPRQTCNGSINTSGISADFDMEGVVVESTQLAGWFSGNSHVMGLMEEEDFSEFLLDVQ
ncbi:putative transcriptional regulatory protein PB24D3,01 [Talaromyces islandicus]|uniref:Putative transcriptional regulatory protein PB24D3,01 n=1 Tax=Talaromyces islandicus TaxID=28573 RepID=A0A0U1LNX9_TALIS|nr:putative transcriptional regulatory protein PB24D3,01 [Talaromyces islandicus]